MLWHPAVAEHSMKAAAEAESNEISAGMAFL
jgi:hypothetical protein